MKKTILLPLLCGFVALSLTVQANNPTLKLLFVGDIMGHSPQIQSAYNATSKSYDYTPCFKYVQPILENADISIGNLEVTLSAQGTYTGYPMFRSPDALASALKKAGFDMLVTANNHSNDNGAYGVTHTVEVLQNLGFHQTGTFKNQRDKDLYYPLLVYKNGFRIAFLNYTYDTNGMTTKAPTVVNLINEAEIAKDMAAAEAMSPDAVIVIMHWGSEYQLEENSVQRNLAQKILSWGADFIIGAHPHVIQPIKKIPFQDAKSGEKKEGIVAFSLGNFISNQQQPNTDGGLMLEIELTKTAENTTVSSLNYIPVWRYLDKTDAKKPRGTFYVLPISAYENGLLKGLNVTSSAAAAMKSFATRMRAHLGKHEGTERKVTKEDFSLTYQKTSNSNPYARFASHTDSVKPRLIIPIYNDALPTDANGGNTQPEPEPYPAPKPTFPEGSTEKSPSPSSPEIAPSKPIAPDNTVKSTDNSTTKDLYLVQFQTSRSLRNSKLPFEGVIIKETGGLFRYYLAAGNTLADAQGALAIATQNGFPDAFILKNNLDKEKTGLPSEYGTTKGGEIKVYQIQFQSSPRFHAPKNLPFAEYQVIEEGEKFRYFTGKSDDLSTALNALKTVQDAGYVDAFIVPFVNGKPVN